MSDLNIDFTNIINSLKGKFEKISNKSNTITDSAQTGDDVKYTTIQAVRTWVNSRLTTKQDTLVGTGEGQNIKTVGGTNILGTGNIAVVTDYDDLTDKPSINNVTLSGNKTSTQLGLQSELTAGSNITINGSTISATDTTYDVATTDDDGLMSSSDKSKLDGIEAQANKYVLPTASASVLGGIKIGTNLSINASGIVSATDTTYNDATTSVHGLMSTSDKSKLDSITVANLELITNKKTSISSSSTDTEYPSAKAVFTAISDAIAGVTQFDYEVVQSLPSTGVKGKIYLVANTGEQSNYYDEYIWIIVDGDGRFEKIGTTQIDLSNYYTKSETDSAIDADVTAHNNSSSAHSSLFAVKMEESDLQNLINDLADAIDDIT